MHLSSPAGRSIISCVFCFYSMLLKELIYISKVLYSLYITFKTAELSRSQRSSYDFLLPDSPTCGQSLVSLPRALWKSMTHWTVLTHSHPPAGTLQLAGPRSSLQSAFQVQQVRDMVHAGKSAGGIPLIVENAKAQQGSVAYSDWPECRCCPPAR